MIEKALFEKAKKEKYLELRQKSIEAGNSNAVYTAEMILALRDMAERDIYPDGRFSDEECNIWSAFHLFHKKS